ncbi:MAG: PhzF family phenazine biosynthesis protein [Pseudomonadota bacterium]
MGRPCDWVDAFAAAPFGGNPCLVVHDAGDLDEAARTALVRETRLSECAYVVPSDRAGFGARYYLADREIPMAGHPTVATVVSLVSRGLVTPPARITLEVGAGVLPVELSAGEDGRVRVTMTQRRPEFGPRQPAAEIAAIFGLPEADIAHPPRIVSTGTPFCVTLLRDREALGRARLDAERLEAWRAAQGVAHAGIMEPYLCAFGGAAGGDLSARLLMAPPSPPEDAFTGSAAGCLGAYLWRERLIERPSFALEQGAWMGRPGRAEVEALGPREDMAGVKVCGEGVVLMSGDLRL